SDRFECRTVMLRVEGNGQSPFTSHYEPGQVIAVPNAHAEGKLQLPDGRLNALEQSGQVAFRYCDPEGNTGAGYPWNPNGAPGDIAGITNPRGNVLGMMPHPERVFHGWQHSDWASNGRDPAGPGDGRLLFEGVVRHLCR
ncbi:MAG: phosphoribosylformylglycinamidine synthase subunit PurQ, partial [Candidatus Poseidoniia archaeon]|nr:phosphoribosylformylglycinamidine synthase subunit PurQ [Candidatus Poseidoniia archaeon]